VVNYHCKEFDMKVLKLAQPLIILSGVLLLCSCSSFQAKRSTAAPMVPPKPLSIPMGKNWQVIEEAPKLSDEHGRVPFQTEQSIQPPGAPPVAPSDNRKLETPR
jgi:hypothetical protein